MNILILGGYNSIVGSNLAFKLKKNGFKITVTGRNLFNKLGLNYGDIKIQIGDFNDPNFVKLVTNNQNVIINCLAGYHPNLNTSEISYSNYYAIKNVVDRALEINCFINLSTVNIHGRIEQTKLSKNSKINPLSEYAIYKAKLEDYLLDSNFNFSTFSLRLPAVLSNPCNNHFLYEIYKELKNNNDVNIYNLQSQFNNVVHINDLVGLITNLVNLNHVNKDAFPIASLEPVKIEELVRFMITNLRSKSYIRETIGNFHSFTIDDDYARLKYDYISATTIGAVNNFLLDLLDV